MTANYNYSLTAMSFKSSSSAVEPVALVFASQATSRQLEPLRGGPR